MNLKLFHENNVLVSLSRLFFDPKIQLSDIDCCKFLDKINKSEFDVSTCRLGNNILHYALMINHRKALLINELYPKLKYRKNIFGQLPVHFAAFHNIDLKPFLAKKMILTDSRGFTPLHISAEKGHGIHLKQLSDLLVSGNDFDAFPLHWVMKNTEKETGRRLNKLIMAKEILHSNSSITSVKNAIGLTPLDWMEKTLSDQEIDYVRRRD